VARLVAGRHAVTLRFACPVRATTKATTNTRRSKVAFVIRNALVFVVIIVA